jgi:polyketide cyclase/dehydrase/lipid transport protein
MKWLLVIFGALAALLLVMAAIGAVLPRAHQATRAADFRQPPAVLYGLVRDFATATPWRSDVLRAELLPPADGYARFQETSRHHTITYLVMEDRPPGRLTMKIADENLPYGGSWTYEFTPTATGTTVRITENGFIKNVLFRFLARFVIGYTGSMETRLRDLGRQFGETTVVRPP